VIRSEATLGIPMRRALVFRLDLQVGAIAPLGGCLEAVTHPLNAEPTAYDDSICKRYSPSKPQVNYACVAGAELSLGD
jgi:hypothetical protein